MLCCVRGAVLCCVRGAVLCFVRGAVLCFVTSDLAPLGVGDAGEAQVAQAPGGVDAVHLQLGQLEGGVEGLGADPHHDGVDGQRHALHHLLRKAVLTRGEGREVYHTSIHPLTDLSPPPH